MTFQDTDCTNNIIFLKTFLFHSVPGQTREHSHRIYLPKGEDILRPYFRDLGVKLSR